MFRSLLIPIDLSPISDRVLGRAVRLPLAEAPRLTLLHVVPRSMPQQHRRQAERDAKRALEEEARSLSKMLPRRRWIERLVRVGDPAAEIVRCAQSVKAELIVMGRGSGGSFRELFLGSTAERVLRRARMPVLVVRLRPRGGYRRPAIALDVDRAAPEIMSFVFRVVPPPRPSMLVIHAYWVPYKAIAYPGLSDHEVDEQTDEYRQRAVRAINRLLRPALDRGHAAPADVPALRMHVRHGSPRTVVERSVRKAEADLLVLGTHGYSGLAHTFLGTVAGDLLRSVACDVLVVPPRSVSGARYTR